MVPDKDRKKIPTPSDVSCMKVLVPVFSISLRGAVGQSAPFGDVGAGHSAPDVDEQDVVAVDGKWSDNHMRCARYKRNLSEHANNCEFQHIENKALPYNF